MSMRTTRLLVTGAAMICLSVGAARAVDSEPDKKDGLSVARAQIAAKKWDNAVAELKRVNDTGNADWNNLMGYSLRKASAPDYVGADRFYDEALRIDPKHRGALEYSGELALMNGDAAKAEQRLAALDKACRLPCEEFTDLKKAVGRYKANGNKYVAAP